MTDDSLPELSGKLLLVYVVNSGHATDGGLLLEYADFQKQAGRLFLTGRVPLLHEGSWETGAQAAVAWDSVTQYLIFNSREDYEERMRSVRLRPAQLLRRWWG